MHYRLEDITSQNAFGFILDEEYYQFGVWPHSGGEYALENKTTSMVYLFAIDEGELVACGTKLYDSLGPNSPFTLPESVADELAARLNVSVSRKV